MLHVKRGWLVVGLASLLALALLSHGSAFGQAPPTPPLDLGPAAPQEGEASQADLYVVPEGGTAEMVDYLKRLQKSRPNPQLDRRAFVQYMVKSATPMWEAADKILGDAGATKEQKVLAARAKFGALGILMQMRNPKAVEAIKSFPEELSKLGLDDMARTVKSQLLAMELGKAARKMPGAQPLDKVLKQIKALVAENPDKGSFQLAYQSVSVLQMLNKEDDAAALADAFAKLYAKSDAADADDLAKKCEGIARRLRLVGKPMKVEGTLLDGTAFDWNAYKGKVVLVQFWATWCGYCVKEIPNIEECYKSYHDRGFDVVAISADRNRAAIEKFLEKQSLPWPILYKEGERNPTADYYGVIGLPTLILVGADGNVVTINARGPKLNEALEKLLGPAEEKKAEETKPTSTSTL